MLALLEGDPWDDPDEGVHGDEPPAGRRRLLQWLLAGAGIASLGLGLVLVMPTLPLAGPRPILAIVLLISLGAWLLRLAWQR
ncbi:MAG: hypothetical protein CL878_08030 [Dehalococcoidia bacterium]|nr:hypothetical protein [Dehalococcoidia bacterium]